MQPPEANCPCLASDEDIQRVRLDKVTPHNAPITLAGYDPGWFEHRMFKGPDTDVNLHVFTAGAAEIDRMLLFRDWLRANDADRDAYLRVKRDLAQRTWRHVQHYADAKTAIVEQIIARAALHRRGSRGTAS